VPLAAGTRLGPYEIAAPIGAGGMGEVYKGRDTRLNRTVAIKVLATHLSDRPDLKARFEREAQTLASLSHSHICPVFDVGRQEGTDYIVMEYIEGRTLADRLRRGALPPDEVLRIAMEIADALDSAHRQGIVHRDLKPGNIMLTTSGAKLLDFGLAKLRHETTPLGALSTVAADAPMTAEGTILGTIQYMAPEQLEGKEADSRADIFAFGAIIHEMVTGKRTFEGASQASVIAAILDRDPPPMSAEQPLTPPLLDRVVKKCLAKNPERRWQAAGDLRDELTWVAEGAQLGPGSTTRTDARYKRLASIWAIAATVLLAVTLLIIGLRSPGSPGRPEEVRFGVTTPNLPNPRHVTISPDGRWIAFPASTASRTTALFVRRIDSMTPEQLPGTEGALAPFWSPDSRYIAFFAGGRIKKVGVTGGPVQNICNAGPDRNGGTWNSAGTVIFAAGGTLQRVSAAGGDPIRIGTLDESRQETANIQPSFLPDGNHFLYLAWSTQQANRAIYVGSLESGDTVKLFDSQSKAAYAAPGYLLFHRGGALFAQPFDAKKIALTGGVVRVAEEIAYDLLSGEAAFAVSDNERLVYYAGGGPAIRREFVWFDRTGHREASAGNPGLYTSNFDLSPDGTRIAVAQRNPENSQYDLWVIDWARKTSARLTFDPALSPNGNVVWSSDGLHIAFSSERRGNRDIFEKKAGGGVETSLVATASDEWPEDWSKDGRYLAYGSNSGSANFGDLYALPLFGDRKPIPVAQSPFAEDEPRFSFDGRWLAYNSNESGTAQVYVVSFPAIDQKLQMSTAGGVQPRWRRDDKELYYLAPDGAMMAVEFRGLTIDQGAPRPLFNTGLDADQARDQFAVSPDGQRFLIQLPGQQGSATPVTVVMNWTAALRK
jgi:Tol biopolymer transport system component/predicted Ser/Thr protein kinase